MFNNHQSTIGNEMKILLVSTIGLLLKFADRHPYHKIIKQWSKLFHLKVKFHNRYSEEFSVDVIEDVLYISRYNKAVHDKYEYLYSIAHEFGHLIDYAYKEYSHKETEFYDNLTDTEAIYRDEVVAWKIAKTLLTSNSEEYDEERFSSLRDRCLEEYRIELKKVAKAKNVKKSTNSK